MILTICTLVPMILTVYTSGGSPDRLIVKIIGKDRGKPGKPPVFA
jgi:hypothetical protein